MSLVGTLAIAAVSVQLIATPFLQYRDRKGWLGIADGLGLTPSWTFFANGGGDLDWTLAIRDADAHGEVGAWTPVAFAAPRTWATLVWNPLKHRRDRFATMALQLGARAAAGREACAETSHAYAQLLRHILPLPPTHAAAHSRQFAVIRSRSGAAAHETVFVSAFHPIA